MATDSLADFTEDTFTWGGATRTVCRKGMGPGVVVISEIPSITPQVADFVRLVVEQGLTVAMPDLFGEAGRGKSLPYMGASIARICASREVTILARHRAASPANLPPHSVVTDDLIEEPGQPTYEARERVLQLFRDQLLTSA